MSGFSQDYEITMLEAAVGKSPEAERWVALTTTAPTKSAAGTAATYTGYARVKTTHTAWKDAVGGEPSEIDNESTLTFAECTGSTSTVKYFEIWTSLSGTSATERVGWGELSVEKTISSGDTASFAAGELKLTQK